MSRCSWLQYFVLNKHFEQLSHLDTDAINIKMTYSLILSFSHFWVDDFTHTQAESERETEQRNDSWRKPMHDSCYHFTTISKYIRPPQNAAFFSLSFEFNVPFASLHSEYCFDNFANTATAYVAQKAAMH